MKLCILQRKFCIKKEAPFRCRPRGDVSRASPALPGIFPNLPGKPVRFSVNGGLDTRRDFLRLCSLHAQTQPVHLPDAPHFQTVGHVFCGAFHAAAGSGADGHGLLPAHFRPGPVHHPPGAEMVQKAHHLAGGVVNIDGAFQYKEIGV